jgi:hypothetical protein
LQPLLLSSPALLVSLAAVVALLCLVLVRYAQAPPLACPLCLVLAFCFQLGFLIVVLSFALALRPERVRQYLLYGAVSGLAAAMFWTLHTSAVTSAAASLYLMRSLTVYSLSYPLVGLSNQIQFLPLTAFVLAAVAVAAVAQRSKTAENERVRIVWILTVLNFVALAAANIPPRSRYVLIFWPAIVMLLTRGLEIIDGAQPVASRAVWGWLRRAAALGLAVGLVVEHYQYSRLNPLLLTDEPATVAAIPRINTSGWSSLLSRIPRDALVVSNDELACMYLVGRIDYWLASNQLDLAQYAIATDAGDYGLYGGSRVISSFDALLDVTSDARARRPLVLILFDTGRFAYREYRQQASELAQRTGGAATNEAPGIFVVDLPRHD